MEKFLAIPSLSQNSIPWYNRVMEHLIKLLKAGWTQERIALAVGVTQSAVSFWKNGGRKPGGAAVKVLKVLAERLP